MLENLNEVAPERSAFGSTQRRDGDLVNQMAEERCFRQDFDVEKFGPRLKRDRVQRLSAVESTGGMDVDHRNREKPLPRQPADPSQESSRRRDAATPDHVIAAVDRPEQRVEMASGPPLLRIGNQDQGRGGFHKPLRERLVLASPGD
jgi:hypothetical protein